jgi:hypothetical protein
MNDKLRLLCYVLAVLAFVAVAVFNRRPTPRSYALEFIAAGLALVTLPWLVDAYKAL